jgi:hypothetical protein
MRESDPPSAKYRLTPPVATYLVKSSELYIMMAGPESDVFTMREYREWLKAAGFRGVKTIRSANQLSPMIVATK